MTTASASPSPAYPCADARGQGSSGASDNQEEEATRGQRALHRRERHDGADAPARFHRQQPRERRPQRLQARHDDHQSVPRAADAPDERRRRLRLPDRLRGHHADRGTARYGRRGERGLHELRAGRDEADRERLRPRSRGAGLSLRAHGPGRAPHAQRGIPRRRGRVPRHEERRTGARRERADQAEEEQLRHRRGRHGLAERGVRRGRPAPRLDAGEPVGGDGAGGPPEDRRRQAPALPGQAGHLLLAHHGGVRRCRRARWVRPAEGAAGFPRRLQRESRHRHGRDDRGPADLRG